jgi:predicted MFS family arabinose efflux permease
VLRPLRQPLPPLGRGELSFQQDAGEESAAVVVRRGVEQVRDGVPVGPVGITVFEVGVPGGVGLACEIELGADAAQQLQRRGRGDGGFFVDGHGSLSWSVPRGMSPLDAKTGYQAIRGATNRPVLLGLTARRAASSTLKMRVLNETRWLRACGDNRSMSAAFPDNLTRAKWALLFGNFVVGCGVMVAAGTLDDLSRSLSVPVSMGAMLLTVGAAVICISGPAMAGVVSGWDRRRLLTLALVWYAAGHVACALVTSYEWLVVLRALTLLAAAVFTPQAATAVGVIEPKERAQSITFIFLGWSLATVVGTPISAWLGARHGWNWAFLLVAGLAILGALWVHIALPAGIRPAALSVRDWWDGITRRPLMALVLITALQSTAQFTLFSFFAPLFRGAGATATSLSLLFAWFGALGLVGSFAMSQFMIARFGAAAAVNLALMLVGLSLVLWPLAYEPIGFALVMAPWALASFAVNSGQQARIAEAAPSLAAAMLALNNSAIYLGQAAGAAGGGLILGAVGYQGLSWLALAWLVAAAGISVLAARTPRTGTLSRGEAR